MTFDLDGIDTTAWRPMAQWSWDADPTPDSIKRTLEAVAEANFGGVCIQFMPDEFRPQDFFERMKIEYLGGTFFDHYRFAIGTAASLGLRVWLYDEGGWPSAQANGQVLRGHEHLRGKCMLNESGRYVVTRTDRADALKLEATQRFLQLTHERYRDAVGEYFGNTIEAVFSDELTVPGCIATERIPWTDDLPDLYEQRHGEPLAKVLPLLFEGAAAHHTSRSAIDEARRKFTSLWIDLFVERCLEPQRQWCDRYGLKWIGHLAGEQDLTRHPHTFGDYFASLRRFSMSGIDTIWRQIWPGHRADFALLAGSVRAVTGNREAMSETGAAYGLDLAPRDWKWLCNQQLMRGVNRFTFMSMPLSGQAGAGLGSVHRHSSVWDGFAQVNDHVARVSAINAMTLPAPRPGVLYPSDDLNARGSDAPGTAAKAITGDLISCGAGAFYIDEKGLLESKVVDGQACVGDARLTWVFLPAGVTISNHLYEKLVEIQAGGVPVCAVGETLPTVFADETGPGGGFELQRVDSLASTDVASTRTAWPFEIDAEMDEVCVDSRDWEGSRVTLVHHENGEQATLTVGSEAVACCNLNDTEPTWIKYPAKRRLALKQGAMLMFVLAKALDDATPVKQPVEVTRCDTLIEGWTLQPTVQSYVKDHRWASRQVTQDAASIEQLGPWTKTVGSGFSGTAMYEASFEHDPNRPVTWLDLGRVEHVAELVVNGQPLGRRCWSPYRFDIKDAIQPGRNTVQVRVSNTLANTWWDPANVQATKDAGRWNIYSRIIEERCPPRLDGGLHGPVFFYK